MRGHQEIDQFADAMRRELAANEHKGDWKADGGVDLFEDLLYHAAKLGLALGTQNRAAVNEYAADVGNLAMMVADVWGALDAQPDSPTLLSDVSGDDQPYDEIKDALHAAAAAFLDAVRAERNLAGVPA